MSWAPLSSQECGAQTSHVLAIGFNQGVVEFAHTVVKGADLAGFSALSHHSARKSNASRSLIPSWTPSGESACESPKAGL